MPGEPEPQQVYDPDLGRERNALPGEIVKPEEEKTLQRLMRQGEEYFKEVYDKVRKRNELTKRFTPDQLDIILMAGEEFAQAKRDEYLEAIRANPANIIRETIVSVTNLGGFGDILTEKLRESVKELVSQVQAGRVSDKQKGRAVRPTIEYAREGILYRKNIVYSPLTSIEIGNSGTPREAQSTLLERLEIVPRADFTTLTELAQALGRTNDIERPSGYIFGGINYEIGFLPLNKPGLEGIFISFTGNKAGIYELSFAANDQGIARIVDAEEKSNPQSKP